MSGFDLIVDVLLVTVSAPFQVMFRSFLRCIVLLCPDPLWLLFNKLGSCICAGATYCPSVSCSLLSFVPVLPKPSYPRVVSLSTSASCTGTTLHFSQIN